MPDLPRTVLSAGGRHVPFGRLDDKACRRLHEASLEILDRTGVRLYHQPAVDLLKRAGASVSDGNRVRIPPDMVEQALKTAPHRVDLYNRHGERVIVLEGQRNYYGTGSDCLYILDHRTGERRKAVLADVTAGIAVCDALPEIDFVMSMFLPADIDSAVADRYQMKVMLETTTKPIVFVTNDAPGCVDAVEMAEAVVGGREALRQRPLVACYINVATGLRHNEEALEKLLFLAERGLPALYIPVVAAGATGPVTAAGAAAMVNAGVLTGLVLSQLQREGAPLVVPGWAGSTLDMRTTVLPYCDPDATGAARSMARFYGLPAFDLCGSDSKVIDPQAAAEAALTIFHTSLDGPSLVHDLGYLESGKTGSLAQLVICHEIVRWLRRAGRPIEVNDQTLALDLIDQVGPDGQFLDSDHTLRNFRQRWYPELFDRGDHSRWQTAGAATLIERAAGRVEEILNTHRPEPLPDDVVVQLDAIVRRAEGKRG